MLAIELDSETERRLERLAELTGRSTSSCAREAIIEHLEDVEDMYLAKERLESPAASFSAQEVKRELGL
jgi:RHH-type rel operon transcriptional repressor/antitoxin RelB